MIYAWATADEYIHARAVEKRKVERVAEESNKTKQAGVEWGKVEKFLEVDYSLPDYAFYIQESPWTCDSRVTVKTIGTDAHVVKFYEVRSKRSVIVCYIPPGETCEIPVPSGKYEIRYGSGRSWHGSDELFGRTGAFAKADRYFELRSDNSLELTLYPVSNGNLATHTINEEDF